MLKNNTLSSNFSAMYIWWRRNNFHYHSSVHPLAFILRIFETSRYQLKDSVSSSCFDTSSSPFLISSCAIYFTQSIWSKLRISRQVHSGGHPFLHPLLEIGLRLHLVCFLWRNLSLFKSLHLIHGERSSIEWIRLVREQVSEKKSWPMRTFVQLQLFSHTLR